MKIYRVYNECGDIVFKSTNLEKAKLFCFAHTTLYSKYYRTTLLGEDLYITEEEFDWDIMDTLRGEYDYNFLSNPNEIAYVIKMCKENLNLVNLPIHNDKHF